MCIHLESACIGGQSQSVHVHVMSMVWSDNEWRYTRSGSNYDPWVEYICWFILTIDHQVPSRKLGLLYPEHQNNESLL